MVPVVFIRPNFNQRPARKAISKLNWAGQRVHIMVLLWSGYNPTFVFWFKLFRNANVFQKNLTFFFIFTDPLDWEQLENMDSVTASISRGVYCYPLLKCSECIYCKKQFTCHSLAPPCILWKSLAAKAQIGSLQGWVGGRWERWGQRGTGAVNQS